MMTRISLFILILLSFLSCNKSNNEIKTPTINTNKFQSIIDSIYQENPQSIGIITHIESAQNHISWSGTSGYSNKNTQAELQADQPVLIASNTKTYVSAAILRLQENELLTIEDPIRNYLTQKTINLFENDGYDLNTIKVKHLLSHTSGISDYVNSEYFEVIKSNPKYRWTRKEQLELAVKVSNPLGKPQEKFSYADVNYLLATEIIEQITEQPFYEAISQLLKYDELRLENTWFFTLDNAPTDSKKLAHQYWNEENWGELKSNFNWDSYDHDISWDLYGGGGIATNMKELAQFSYSLFNGKIIKNNDVLELIKTDVATTDGKQKTYRLGIANATIKGLESLGHGGFWGTQVFHIPQLNTSISVCVLERKGKMKIISSILNTYIKELTTQLMQAGHYVNKDYELYKAQNSKATLVLFPGGASTAKDTKKEFDIVTAAIANNISVLFMNFNRHLWIDDSTSKSLVNKLDTIFQNKELAQSTYIGGMSIGGNVALTVSERLLQENNNISLKGTFIVDSPIDLYQLYKSSVKDISNTSFTDERLSEAKWIVNYFENEFTKDSLSQNIQYVTPFTLENGFSSVLTLKNSKLRFYTEPDTSWWKETRNTDFESTNAYVIQQIANNLKQNSWNQFELIETKNKGYQLNGNKNPHSWSIVNSRNLIEWMNE